MQNVILILIRCQFADNMQLPKMASASLLDNLSPLGLPSGAMGKQLNKQ